MWSWLSGFAEFAVSRRNTNKVFRTSQEILFEESVALCWIPAASTSPLLCVHLGYPQEKGCKNGLSQYAAFLFRESLKLVPNHPDFEDVKGPEIREAENNKTLTELKKKASREGKGVFLKADMTAEGAVCDMQAVGLGPNKQLKDRAFWLAMSATIVLRHPEGYEKLCETHKAMRSLMEEAWRRGDQGVQLIVQLDVKCAHRECPWLPVKLWCVGCETRFAEPSYMLA